MMIRHTFTPLDNVRLGHLCGPLDEHLRAIEAVLPVTIHRRQGAFRIEGGKKDAERVLELLQMLYERARKAIAADTLQLALDDLRRGSRATPMPDAAEGDIVLHTRRADLAGRTPNQVQYLRQILSHDISFGIGPAGTGKTFLAVACAVDALERSAVQRIVLTRPAVEAGERLGFLPGDMKEKVDPYLRPLYDALHDMLPAEQVARRIASGEIEIAPLAFMRGRTLAHCFAILDEAQNTTAAQMKMFLTRMGEGTRMVVTGDITQSARQGAQDSRQPYGGKWKAQERTEYYLLNHQVAPKDKALRCPSCHDPNGVMDMKSLRPPKRRGS